MNERVGSERTDCVIMKRCFGSTCRCTSLGRKQRVPDQLLLQCGDRAAEVPEEGLHLQVTDFISFSERKECSEFDSANNGACVRVDNEMRHKNK